MRRDGPKGAGDAEQVVLTNWAFTRLGTLLLLCSTGDHPPPQADFEVWLERLAQRDYSKLLIHTEGGSPSATQRSRITALLKSRDRAVLTALLTDSVVSRGLLTAIEWVVNSGKMKAFALSELGAALAWLDAAGAANEVAAGIERLTAALRARRVGA